MKRITAAIFCLFIILNTGTLAIAEETSNLILSYNNTANYEISIPTDGNLDFASGTGTIEINMLEIKLEDNQVVAISADSKNYDNGWYLVNEEDPEDKIEYFIGTSEDSSDIGNENFVIFNENDTSKKLYVKTSDTKKVGVFKDTITFKVDIQYALKGTWIFNESINLPDIENNKNISQTINGSTDNSGFEYFMINNKTIGIGVLLPFPIYNLDNGWAADKYRTVTFEETPQVVSSEFYEWFIKNAVQQ